MNEVLSVAGLVTLVVINVLDVLDLTTAYKTFEWVSMALFPNFNLGQGISIYYISEYFKKACNPYMDLCGNPNITINFCCNKDCKHSFFVLRFVSLFSSWSNHRACLYQHVLGMGESGRGTPGVFHGAPGHSVLGVGVSD